MKILEQLFLSVTDTLLFIYAVTIGVFYLAIAILSIKELKVYKQKNYFIDLKQLLSSPFAPGVSIIAPAYNEGLTIIDNVKSLLSLQYNNFEIVVVNDGSKDDSLEKLITYFNLVKTNFDVEYQIDCKQVRGVYKSNNRAFRKLLVVDKFNGGKADALNAGLNIASSPYVACIDVDCIIEPDALLKMVKPVLESKTRVIAVGGVVRVANSCEVEEGRLLKVNLPENVLARFQTLEYLRAFLLGRMGWSGINGLMLISGAFGVFDKEVAIKAGGYNHKTVGEDMELVVRMRRYMHEQKQKYKIVFVPEPLCWTEAPVTTKVLSKQRNRWTRGTAETLNLHKVVFLNPKYGILGMLSFPYWLFFEWLAPFVEVSGLIYFLYLVLLGKVNWLYFSALFLLIYSLAVFLSVLALYAEEITYFKYSKKSDTAKMILFSMIEPFFYHPQTVIWAIRGNIDLLKGKKTWGEMTRTGFKKQAV